MVHHMAWVRATAATAAAIAFLAIPQAPPPPSALRLEEGERLVRWLDLGVPTVGVSIALIEMPTMPVTTYMLGRHEGRSFLVRSMDQLVGLVRIETPEHALRWARFADGMEGRDEIRQRTTPPAWYTPGPYPLRPGDRRRRTYSTTGELTAGDMRAGGFAEPVVEQRGGKFVLTRWVYEQEWELANCRVARVRETIGPDGAIERTVLARRKAPDLPEGTWLIRFGRM